MTRQYTIGQLARAAGVPTTTLRYYERVGLVAPRRGRRTSIGSIPGTPSRSFASSVPHKRPGLRSTDVRTLLALDSGNLALCKDVQPLIAKRLAEVSQRLEELRHIQRLLRSFLAQCHAQDQDTLCHVVDTLSGALS